MFREEESLFSKAKFVSKGWPTVWISFVLPFCGFLTDHIHFSYCILSSNVTVLSQSETSGYLHLPPAPIQWQPVLIKHNAVESYHDQFNTSCLYGEVRAVCQMGTVSEGMVSRGTIVADGPTKNSSQTDGMGWWRTKSGLGWWETQAKTYIHNMCSHLMC